MKKIRNIVIGGIQQKIFNLALIAILPAFAGIFGVQREFAAFFGGTSLLILVGVVLDTLMQIESHLMMRHYDGLLDTGRVRVEH